MDPNANLREQEQIVMSRRKSARMKFRLRELRLALKNWMRSGGFEPDWSITPNASRYFGVAVIREKKETK